MTVGWWFGREVRLADSVFNSFLGFIRRCTEIELHTLAFQFFLSKTVEIPNSNRFSSKIKREGERKLHMVGPIFFMIYWLADTHLQSKYDLAYQLLWHILIPNYFTWVWYCDIVEWDPGGMRSKLSLSFTLSSPLGGKRPNFPSVQLPVAWMKGSDKTNQDFKVGILNEDRRRTTNSESRVEAAW